MDKSSKVKISPRVISVSLDARHEFSKSVVSRIKLVEGEGVEGDAHRGVTVQHRSRLKKDPNQPNLRQVHLLHTELISELKSRGFCIQPGTLGENIMTEGLNLLDLPTNTVLQVGKTVQLKITGLRNPCSQLDNFQKGLTAAVLDRDGNGELIRKAGIMAIVLTGGIVTPGDEIAVHKPVKPHESLKPV